jgi:hypothetical protein
MRTRSRLDIDDRSLSVLSRRRQRAGGAQSTNLGMNDLPGMLAGMDGV